MGIKLVGNNLGEKHRELNWLVVETASNKVDFADVKNATEESDVDRLFKIEVASKFKNVDYIMEVFKCGDTLCISRALRCCDWLFSDEFSNVMNADYLHQNVFPFMSIKMKKKLLSALYIHVKNETRAANFYTYCMNTKLTEIAYKFLLSTSEQFKLQLSTKSWNYTDFITNRVRDYTKHFIKTSFLLAEAYLENFEHHRTELIYQLRYLYSVSDKKYLDLLEKYKKPSKREEYTQAERFGLQLSKDIISNHKQRVIQKPYLYIGLLNKGILAKNSTAEDAKSYIPAILPDNFWSPSFCYKYKYIIDLIPQDEKFKFMKKAFNNRYSNIPFETSYEFYRNQCFMLMTREEQECWALQQIADQLEILGAGEDYKFYRFVNFEKAFSEIKKLVMITNDKEKRLKMVSVLIESAKNLREVEKLLNYFYERHVNEVEHAKKKFLNAVIEIHNPFEFDESCWTALNKIFYSLEVYSVTSTNINTNYIVIALICHIIKNKELPTALTNYVEGEKFDSYKLKWGTDKLIKEEKDIVCQYLINFYINKINKIKGNENNTKEMRKYLHYVLDILCYHKKIKTDCPDMIIELCKSDWQEFKYHLLLMSESDNKPEIFSLGTCIRGLKTNAAHVIKLLPTLRQNVIERPCNKVDLFLKKVKVYFPEALAERCLDLYKEILNEKDLNSKTAQAAARAIFLLADNRFKVDFMEKHAPLESKIDYDKTDQTLLYIQQAICAHVIVSRPPVPLSNTMMYIKGDYLKYCIPIFNSYLANLPLPLCKEFAEFLLKQPVSVQKHGLRLAFLCFDKDSLVTVLTRVWKKTKNVSMRMEMYSALFRKILEEEPESQSNLYKILKSFTLDLNEDDDDKLFRLITSNELPALVLGDYILTSLELINKLPQKIQNLQRLQNIIRCVTCYISLIPKESIEPMVYEHINDRFTKHDEQEDHQEENWQKQCAMIGVMEAKWQLVVRYVTYIQNNEDLEYSLKTTKLILKHILEQWNVVDENIYITRKLFMKFIEELSNVNFGNEEYSNKNIKILFQNILEVLPKTFTMDEIYMLLWDVRLNVIARDVIINWRTKFNNGSDDEKFTIFKEVGINYAKEVGVLIKEYIGKNAYYTSFSSNIKDKVLARGSQITFALIYGTKLSLQDFYVAMCLGLIQLKVTETNMVALSLIPLDYDGKYLDDYENLLEEFKKIDDKEFRSKLYHKFVNNDLQYRQFMQTI